MYQRIGATIAETIATDLQDIKDKEDISPEPLLRIDSTRPSGQQLSVTDVSTPRPVPTEQSRAANIGCWEHIPYRAKNRECCKRFWSFEPEVAHFRQGIKMSHLLELQGSLEIKYLIKHQKKKSPSNQQGARELSQQQTKACLVGNRLSKRYHGLHPK
jgi:hypothetical protein